MLEGWPAGLFLTVWGFAQLTAGIGLLRLRPWARLLAISIFVFGILNCLAMLLPGTASRFEQINATMQAKMGLPTATPPAMMHFGLWVGAIFGVVGVVIQLWFVVTRKEAFLIAADIPALSS